MLMLLASTASAWSLAHVSLVDLDEDVSVDGGINSLLVWPCHDTRIPGFWTTRRVPAEVTYFDQGFTPTIVTVLSDISMGSRRQ